MSTTISRDELKTKLDRHEDFTLVETLAEPKFEQVHLPGTINLPPDQVSKLASQRLPDKNAEIVVYCASGSCNASENAARDLETQGYKNVRRYVEGKQDWVDAGLPTEGARQPAQTSR